jgi:hypothetical protein
LPASRSHFEHKIVGLQFGRVDDAMHRDRVNKKVLGERAPRAGVRI